MQRVTFYGHFVGWWSYAAVCRELARYLERHVDLRLVDLVRLDGLSTPPGYRAGVSWAHFEDCGVSQQLADLELGRKPEELHGAGTALVFTNPSNLPAIPQHDHMVVFAVPDATEAPQPWVDQLNERAHVVLTPSEWSRQSLRRSGVEPPIYVVRHGLSPVFCPPAEEAERSKVRFFCTSQSGLRKGIVELIEALKRTGLPSHQGGLVIHTEWPEVIDLFYDAGLEDVEFVDDPVGSPAAMAELLQQTDLLLAPSRAEGFGLLPLEAMACGCRALVSQGTGHAEWLSDISQLTPLYRALEMLDLAPLDASLHPTAAAPTINVHSLARHLEALFSSRLSAYRRTVWAKRVGRQFAWPRVLSEDNLLDHLLPL